MRLRQSDDHQRRARAPFVVPDVSGARNPAGPGPRPESGARPECRSKDPAATRPLFGPAFWPRFYGIAPRMTPRQYVARFSVGREVLRALAFLVTLAVAAALLLLLEPDPLNLTR